MIKVKMIQPMFTALVTTMDVYEHDNTSAGGLITKDTMAGALKEYQKVVAVGTTVRDIKVGDLVKVNPKRFGVVEHKRGNLEDNTYKDNMATRYIFDVIELDGVKYLLLQDRDIDYIVTDYEEVPDPKPQTPSNLISTSIFS